jgi:hypothetical protein
MNKFNTISLVFKIYRQNRLEFANLFANLVRNFITNFHNLMRNFRIWLAISNQLDYDLVFIVPKFPTNLAIGVAKVSWNQL